jgi:hypothetical protein
VSNHLKFKTNLTTLLSSSIIDAKITSDHLATPKPYGLGFFTKDKRPFLCIHQAALTDELINYIIDHDDAVPVITEITPQKFWTDLGDQSLDKAAVLDQIPESTPKIIKNLMAYAIINDESMLSEHDSKFSPEQILNVSVENLFLVNIFDHRPEAFEGLSWNQIMYYYNGRRSISFELIIGPNLWTHEAVIFEKNRKEKKFRTFIVTCDKKTYEYLKNINMKAVKSIAGAIKADMLARSFLDSYERGIMGFLSGEVDKSIEFEPAIKLLKKPKV